MNYTEYTKTVETEFGSLDIIYITEDGFKRVECWLNGSRILVPLILNSPVPTIVKKVYRIIRAGQRLGVTIGGVK